jgi:two-component system chemotaxis response regulator CheY
MKLTKRVLDVGNCIPDHAAIRQMIESRFNARVLQAHRLDDTIAMLEREPVDLVLVNRKLDQDYSDGIEVIRKLKALPQFAQTPMMLVTNLADHQRLAVEQGAEPGFGKLALDAPETEANLRRFLA